MESGGRNCTGVSAPVYLSFLNASVSLVLCLLTSVGNLLVCLTVYKDPNKQLRTPFNMFVVNLACADLIVGFVVSPISVVIHMKEGLTDEVLVHERMTIHMSYFISCTASVLSLAALTIDRHTAITSPLYYRGANHTRKVATASLAIWIISASLPFVYFKVGFVNYAFVFANTAICLHLVILVVCARTFRKMQRRAKDLARLQAVIPSVTAAQLADERESRRTKAFLLMLVAFLSCYIPSCVMIYVMKFCTTCSCYSIHWLRDAEFLLVLLNSCLNPFVYAWRIPTFRTALVAITRQRQTAKPHGRIHLHSMNNSPFTSERCLAIASTPNLTSPPLQLVTKKEQSEILNVKVSLHDKDGAQDIDQNCVFDRKL